MAAMKKESNDKHMALLVNDNVILEALEIAMLKFKV